MPATALELFTFINRTTKNIFRLHLLFGNLLQVSFLLIKDNSLLVNTSIFGRYFLGVLKCGGVGVFGFVVVLKHLAWYLFFKRIQ